MSAAVEAGPRRYDRRALSYAGTFPSPARRLAIRAIEWASAKPRILARVRAFEARAAAGEPQGARPSGARSWG